MAVDDDPEVNWFRDDRGARLMVGVETDRVKLAALVPEHVPRSKVRRAVRECSRELEHYVETSATEPGPRSDRPGD